MSRISDTALTVLGIAASLLCAAACSGRKNSKPQPQEPAVTVERAATDSVTVYSEYPATMIADRTNDIVAEVNGRLTNVLYSGGDWVEKGQLLFTIDPVNYVQQVQEAQASLAQAKAQYEYAEPHYQAVKRALASNAVSKMEVAQALSARDQALAAINTARAQLAQAQTQLAKCRITAPNSGHMAVQQFSVGSYIAGAGSPVKLGTLYVDNLMIVNFNIPEQDLPAVRRYYADYKAGRAPEMPVSFGDSLQHSYTARMIYLGPDVDANTGTTLAQAHIQNPYGELHAGMYLNVELPLQRLPKAVLVKDAAVQTDQRGTFVYTLGDSSKVEYTPVTAGPVVRDSMRVIYDGISPNTPYVNAAVLKVRPGMKVKAVY